MLIILVLLSLAGAVKSTTCNSFPKIFGGSVADTGLYHIDVYNDYMALVGNTWDSTISTVASSLMQYLALTSISTGGKYYWAKVLSLKTNSNFVGV